MANSFCSDDNVDPRTQRFREEYQGKHFFTKDGKVEFEIVDARSYGDVDIQFIESGLIKNTKVGNIKAGMTNPFYNSAVRSGKGDCPVAFDTFQHQYNGCIFRTNEGYNIQITNYVGDREVHYRFLNDPRDTEGCTTIQNIRKGQVKNPYGTNSCGGYSGPDTQYNTDEYDWLNNIWYNMTYRATGKRNNEVNCYNDILLEPAWLCYNVFAFWYMDEISKLNPKYSYALDKDVLYPYYSKFSRGRKAYSRYTCTLIPKELNVCIPRSDMDNNSVSEKKKNEMRQNLDRLSKFYLSEGAITYDTYAAIRSLYVRDPQFADYLPERYRDMYNLQTFEN